MRKTEARILILAILGVVLAFLGSSVFTMLVSAPIDRDAASIRTSAAPGVASLVRARSLLLEVVDDADAATIRQDLRGVAEALAHYLALPGYEGERPLAAEAMHRLMALQALAAGPIDRHDLHLQVMATDEGLRQLILYDIGRTYHYAKTIGDAWHRSLSVGLLLAGMCVLIAALSTVLAVRAIRRSTRALETRAHELELFAGRVAHDVMSPLTTLKLNVGLIKERHRGDAETQAMTARTLSSLQRVGAIVDGLFDFARSGAKGDVHAATRVPEALEGLFAELRADAAREGITLTSDGLPPCTVSCAGGVLMSILSNLIRNAIKYMGDGPERRIQIVATIGAARVRFEVSDTGKGIAPKLQRVVFNPYIRGPGCDRPGIGLGLSTVKRFVEAHGGSIGLSSAVGRGTTVWFELPGQPATSGGPASRDAEEAAAGSG